MDAEKMRDFQIALQNGNIETVRNYLLLSTRSTDINITFPSGFCPIHIVCRYGYIKIVRLLIKNNCFIESETNNNWRPIHFACKYGYIDIVRLLIKNNCDRESRTRSKRRPIHYATLNGFINIVTLLIQNKCNIECETDNKWRPIHYACICGYTNIVKLLIENKCNIDCETINKRRPIHIACMSGSIHIIELLIENNCEILCKDSHGKTPLDLAAQLKRTDCVELLDDCIDVFQLEGQLKGIKKGSIANENLPKIPENQNKYIETTGNIEDTKFRINYSSLHSAVCNNDLDEVKWILVNRTVHVNITCVSRLCECISKVFDESDTIEFYNVSPLHCAVLRGYENICGQLIRYGADCMQYVEIIDHSKESPNNVSNKKNILSLTTRENALTLCLKYNQTLFRCFCHILDVDKTNCCDSSYNSLLHIAACCLQPDICNQLLEAGALVNSENDEGNTCLEELLFNIDESLLNDNIDRVIEITDLLMTNGLHIKAKPLNGLNVLQHAMKMKNEKLMIKLLTNTSAQIINKDEFDQIFVLNWFDSGDLLMKYLSKKKLASFISSSTILQNLDKANRNLIKSLYNDADTKVQQSVVEDILYNAVIREDESLFDYMLSKSIKTTKLFDNGETLLTNILILNKKKFFLKMILSNHIEMFANSKNNDNQTALQVAIELGDMDIVDKLIKSTHETENEDIFGDTALMQLVKKLSICTDITVEKRYSRAIESINGQEGNIRTSYDESISDFMESEELDPKDVNTGNNNLPDKNECAFKQLCLICEDDEINCALQCGHTFCMKCAEKLKICAVCRQPRTKIIRIFIG